MAWYWWALAALVLAGAELVNGQLVLLMLAVGAAAGGISSAAGLPTIWQAIVAGLVAVLMLVAVRPLAVKQLRMSGSLRTGIDAVRGARGVVLEKVDAHDGRVKVNGEIWSARSYDPYVTVEPGGSVMVVEIQGATAIVLPTEL